MIKLLPMSPATSVVRDTARNKPHMHFAQVQKLCLLAFFLLANIFSFTGTFAQNRTIWGSKFRIGINSTSSATNYEWYYTTAESKNGPNVLPGARLNFGTEAYGGGGTAVAGTVAGNVRIYYNVHRTDQSAGTFAVANVATTNPATFVDRRFELVFGSSNIDLAALTGNQEGSYVLEAYYLYDLFNVDNAAANKQGSVNTSDVRYPNSGTHRLTFNLGAQVVRPTITPNGGIYALSQNVTLATTTAGATIRYTVSNTAISPADPTATTGTEYTGPITLTQNTILKARAFKSGNIDSDVASASFTVTDANTVTATSFSPATGTRFAVSQLVTLTNATEGSTIRYTVSTSGTAPADPTATTGIEYTGPFTIVSNAIIKARGFKPGLTDSPVTSATFTRQDPGLWGAKFRIQPAGSGITNVEWYYGTETKPGPNGVVGSRLSFGAEGHGSSDVPSHGLDSGRVLYRVYAVGQTPPATFTAANLRLNDPNLLTGNRQIGLDPSTSGIDLVGLVGSQPGHYRLEAYYTFGIFERAVQGNTFGAMQTPSRAVGRFPGGTGVQTMTFSVLPAAPAFDPPSDTYDNPIQVTITASVNGSTIRYTLDGTEPTATTGAEYTGPFTLSATATIKAKSFRTDLPPSVTRTVTYKIDPYNPNIYPRFVVRGTQIFQKNSPTDSTIFRVKGTNFNGPNWNWDFEDNLKDSTKIFDVWGFNSVRINLFLNSFQKGNPRYWNEADDAYLDLIIEKLTRRAGKKIVCMIEVHDYTGGFPGFAAAAAPSAEYFKNWWKKIARRYKNNPYVWFNPMNEPGFFIGDYAANATLRQRWLNAHTSVIDSIRSTQADNIVIVDAISFASEAVGYGTVLDASPHRTSVVKASESSVLTDGRTLVDYDPKHNLAFNIHPYTAWDTPDKFRSYMNLIRQARDAGNPLCVFVGEFMPTFRQDGATGWQAGWASRAAWDLLKWYREENTDDLSPGWMIWHWMGAGAQKLTYDGGGKDANTNSFNTRPTNLNREGAWIWDMLHNPSALVSWIPVSADTTKLEMEQARGWKDAVEVWPGWTRTNIPANADRYTGHSVTTTNTWTEWDINVQQAGTYRLIIRGFNRSGEAGQFEVRDYAGSVIGRGSIPANPPTDGNFRTSSFSLPAGNQILRLNKLNGADAQYTYVLVIPAVPDVAPPTQPQALTQFAAVPFANQLQWSASTDDEGVRGYEVYRNGSLIVFTGNTFFVDQNLAPSTGYRYTVVAVDNSNNKSLAADTLIATTSAANAIVYNIDNTDIGTGLNKVAYNAIATSGTAVNGWAVSSNAALYNGSEHYTTQNNATFQTTFNGVQARVFGTLKSGHGDMKASVDGGAEYDFPVSFYTPGADRGGAFVFATPLLPKGEHTLLLRNLGRYVAIDRIEINTGDLDTQAPTVPTDLAAFYNTSKQGMLQWDASADNIGVTEYEVFRNGVPVGKTTRTYFAYPFAAASGETADFTVAALDLAQNRSAQSAALTVVQRPAGQLTNIDDKATGTGLNQVEFSSLASGDAATDGWRSVNVAGNFGGSEIYTTRNNATATIRFYGNQLIIYGTKKPNHGEMRVAVDGADEYAIPASFFTPGAGQVSAFIWATPDLALGNHTVVLRNLGSYVAFDYAQSVVFCNAFVSLAATHVTCNGSANGALTATAVNTSGTVAFELFRGTVRVDSNATGTFAGLAAGQYTVQINAGGCTATASAEVVQPATLASSNVVSAAQVCNGQSSTITVTATGGTAPYQYSFDNGATYGSSNAFTAGSIAASATYYLKVKDANNCEVADSVRINLHTVPAIKTQPKTATVCYNTPATFTIETTGSVATYAWFRNGQALNNSGKYAGVNTATLTVQNVGVSDAGLYTVSITGPCSANTITSNPATLIPIGPPIVVIQPLNQQVKAGSQATLSVTALNADTYQWQKKSASGVWENVVNTSNISGATSGNLVITSATAANAGFYKVLITSNCNIKLSTPQAELKVTGRSARMGEDAVTSSVVIYPNPANDRFVMRYESASEQKVQLLVRDQTGRTVLLKELTLFAGVTEIPVESATFAPGLYTVHLQANQQSVVGKIVITR